MPAGQFVSVVYDPPAIIDPNPTPAGRHRGGCNPVVRCNNGVFIAVSDDGTGKNHALEQLTVLAEAGCKIILHENAFASVSNPAAGSQDLPVISEASDGQLCEKRMSGVDSFAHGRPFGAGCFGAVTTQPLLDPARGECGDEDGRNQSENNGAA